MALPSADRGHCCSTFDVLMGIRVIDWSTKESRSVVALKMDLSLYSNKVSGKFGLWTSGETDWTVFPSGSVFIAFLWVEAVLFIIASTDFYFDYCRMDLSHELQSAAKLFEHLRLLVWKNSSLIEFYEINICQDMIFRLCTVYTKHGITKIGNRTREKTHVLSQVLEHFCCRQ